jgi:hypothetical protein
LKYIYSKYGPFCKKGQYYFAIPENETDVEELKKYPKQEIPARSGW